MKANRSEAGFSLLEVLIALFLLLIILGGSILLLDTAGRNWFHGESEVSVQTEARNLIAFFDRLIPGAVLADASGDQRLEFVGSADRLSFYTLLAENKKETDLAGTEVFWKEGEKTLYVSEERGAGRSGRSGSDTDGAQPLSFRVAEFKLSFLDGEKYLDSWDSRKGAKQEDRLPRAVAAEFRLLGPQSKEGRAFSRDFKAVFEMKNN